MEALYDNPPAEDNRKYCSSVNTTQTVSRVLHEGNNYHYIVNIYGKSKNWPSLDHKYLTTKVEKEYIPVYSSYPITVNLETGEKKESAQAFLVIPLTTKYSSIGSSLPAIQSVTGKPMHCKQHYIAPEALPLDLVPEGALLGYSTENLKDKRNWENKDGWE